LAVTPVATAAVGAVVSALISFPAESYTLYANALTEDAAFETYAFNTFTLIEAGVVLANVSVFVARTVPAEFLTVIVETPVWPFAQITKLAAPFDEVTLLEYWIALATVATDDESE
jgi:hypothetical protein